MLLTAYFSISKIFNRYLPYFHIDVYKRQLLIPAVSTTITSLNVAYFTNSSLNASARSGQLQWEIASILFCESVSYTHLDTTLSSNACIVLEVSSDTICFPSSYFNSRTVSLSLSSIRTPKCGVTRFPPLTRALTVAAI